MEFFWQFFAVGITSFFIGMLLGRAVGINQLLMQQQQQPSQQVSPEMMRQMMGRGPMGPPTLPNGPA